MTSANTVLFSEDAPSETPGQLSKKKSSRDSAFALLSRAPTNLSQSGGAGGSTSSPKTSQRSPGSKPLASRPSPSRAPTSGTQGAAASQDGELPAYMGRGRRTVKPWKPSTPHPSHVEEREPKGWSLSHILSKATWSMKLSKAFAPHLTPGGDPNAVRVGVRMRPMNDYEIKRGEREKSKEFIKTSGTQLRISNPRPPPGQEAKTDEFAYDALFLPEVREGGQPPRGRARARPGTRVAPVFTSCDSVKRGAKREASSSTPRIDSSANVACAFHLPSATGPGPAPC